MFPTAGYFRGTNCPFFVHGLCHRPYCHFRHSKPGLKTSKTKPSPHKSCKEEFPSLNNTKTTVTQDLDSTRKVVHSEEGKVGLSKDAKTSTQLRGILKRSTSEEEQTKVHSSNKDNSTSQDLYHNKTEDGTKESLIVNTESLELDDYEQPVPSLTDEEKLIIGLPTIMQRKDREHETCLEKNGSLQKTSGVDACGAKTDSDVHLENKQMEEDGGSDLLAGTFTSDALEVKEKDMKNFSEGTCKETAVDKNDDIKQTENGATVDHMEITGSINKDAEEMSNQTSAMKRKSIHLEVSNDVQTEVESVTTDTVGNATKKRKSQLLPCDMSVDNLSQAVELSPKDNCFKEIINKQAKKLKSQCDSNFLKKIRESGMLLFDGKEKSKSKTVLSLTDSKPDFGSVKITESKALTKQPSLDKLDVLKKKAKISESGIDFFGFNKKLTKQKKIEKRKADEGVSSSSKNSEIKRSSPAKGKEHTKKLKTAIKSEPTYIAIDSSEESNACSPVFSDSSPEEEDQLKRIWNDFEPQEVSIDEDVKIKSPVKKQKHVELPKKNTLSYPVSEKPDAKKQSLLADTLGLGKKQRVAHAANHLPRRLSSNANPVRRYPKTLAAVATKEPSIAGTSLGSSISEASSSSHASRKRIAHVPKNVTPAGSLPRPKIPLEYGAKVPQNQRQRYLDRIVDEYLRMCPSEKVAYEKAVEEEKALYERSSRRQVYLNLCVNAIKKLRGMTSIEIQEAKNNAVVKTLPSGAVVVSTKSPVPKQQRIPQSVSNELTEEILYNCLTNYLLSEDNLVENGYPRPCPNSPGKAVFKSRKEQPAKGSTRRTCCRCGKPFVVLEDGEYLTKEECVYHAGKLFRRRGEPITNYSCCQGDAGSPGCCVGKVHVSDTVCDPDGFMTTIVSPLRENNYKVFAIDCEMCYTTAGLELTRITVVNWNLEKVYDSFVRPERRIVDFNTRFSGVTEESLRGVTTTIREIQAVLLSMIHRDTILVGHSLESDLKAIKLIHSKAVDTSVVFPHRLGPPYKRALRNLMAEHLNKIIQDGVDGHDSHEDASACLELMRWKVKEDIKRATRTKGPLYTKC